MFTKFHLPICCVTNLYLLVYADILIVSLFLVYICALVVSPLLSLSLIHLHRYFNLESIYPNASSS